MTGRIPSKWFSKDVQNRMSSEPVYDSAPDSTYILDIKNTAFQAIKEITALTIKNVTVL